MIKPIKNGKYTGSARRLAVIALILCILVVSAGFCAEKTLPIDELKGGASPAPTVAASQPAPEASASPATESGSTPAPVVTATTAPAAGIADKTPAAESTASPKPSPTGTPAKDAKAKDKADEQFDIFAVMKDETPITGDVAPPVKSPVNIPLTLISMLAVCLLAYILLKVFGKYLGNIAAPGTRKKMINIIDKQMLAPNKQICVVEVPGKTILIGMTDNEINMLCELDENAVAEFKEPKEEKEIAPSSAASYLTDVFMKKWPGGK